MINKIFFDIDETLIHSEYGLNDEVNFNFVDKFGNTYYTYVRPCSNELIEYARNLVGAENVHILTAATLNYASQINEKAGWGFSEDDIFAREIMEKYSIQIPSLYGSSTLVNPHPYAHQLNVLIDNLPSKYNNEKIDLMAINPRTNYLQVRDYMGDNSDDEAFREQVKEFLKTRIQYYYVNQLH